MNTLTAKYIYRLIIWTPWAWFLLLFIYALIVTLQVGHFPSYGQPDPKYAGAVSLLYAPTIILLLGVIALTPFGLILTVVKWWKGMPLTIRRSELIFYLVGIGLFYLFIFTDVVGLMEWLMD